MITAGVYEATPESLLGAPTCHWAKPPHPRHAMAHPATNVTGTTTPVTGGARMAAARIRHDTTALPQNA